MAIAILIIGSVANSLLFFYNPLLVLIGVLAVSVMMVVLIRNTAISIWVLYLYLFQFFSVDVLGMKLYDIAAIVFVVVIIAKGQIRRETVAKPDAWFFLTFLIFLLFSQALLHRFSSSAFIELTRYLMCFSVLLIFGNLQTRFEDLKKYLLTISIVNLIQGIIIFVGAYYFFGEIATDNDFAAVGTYYNPVEPRVCGFSLDPNKYYTYCFFIVIVFDLFGDRNDKIVRIGRYVNIVGALISLSRAAIFVTLLYLILNMFERKVLAGSRKLILMVGVFAILFIALNFSSVIHITNNVLETIAEITGRTRTLEYEPNITEGNRMFIWKATFALVGDSPIFGHGLFAWEGMLPYPPHNTILVILLDIGIIGLTLYVLLIRKLIISIFNYSIFFLLFLPSLTLDMQHYRLYFILLAILSYKALDSGKPITEHNSINLPAS